MLRIIVLIVFSLFVIPVHSQSVITKSVIRKGTKPALQKTQSSNSQLDLSSLTGKWQEIKRTLLNSEIGISFADSLQLDFYKRDSVILRDGIGISQNGSAGISDINKLEVAGDRYTILSLSKNKLTISDGEYIRYLQKRKLFYHETLGRLIVPKENLSEARGISSKKLLGEWDIYRTQAVPGNADDSSLIKKIRFSHYDNKNNLKGSITFSKNNKSETVDFTAVNSGGLLIITTPVYSWNLSTYKGDGKEFIFGHHGGLVYFAKQLE